MAQAHAVDPIARAKAGDRQARRDAAGAEGRAVPRPFDKFRNGVKYGVLAGAVIGVYQIVLNLTEGGINIGYGILGFFLAIPVVWWALREYRDRYAAAGSFFKNGAIYSMYISVFAGLTSAALAMIGSEVASVEGTTFFQVAANAVFQVVIGIVLLNTIGFALLQYFKPAAPEDEFVELEESTDHLDDASVARVNDGVADRLEAEDQRREARERT